MSAPAPAIVAYVVIARPTLRFSGRALPDDSDCK
jgi:hypothetical protein